MVSGASQQRPFWASSKPSLRKQRARSESQRTPTPIRGRYPRISTDRLGFSFSYLPRCLTESIGPLTTTAHVHGDEALPTPLKIEWFRDLFDRKEIDLKPIVVGTGFCHDCHDPIPSTVSLSTSTTNPIECPNNPWAYALLCVRGRLIA